MSNEIESKRLFIKDVFTKWYRIPEYQRPYVWESDQVNELLDDISEAMQYNPDAEYFLGSLVLQKKKIKSQESGEFEQFDLLDGQQRLTTLFLITAVIRDLTQVVTRKLSCQTSIYQMANPDDGIPERIRITFDIRGKVKEFVQDYIKKPGGTLEINEASLERVTDISINNMIQAIILIKDFFNQNDTVTIDDFYPYLRKNVLLIYVSTEKLNDAFRLFTVLNDRGLKLRNCDILKAENLRALENQNEKERYAILWENIEEYFGDSFDNFLSYIRTILVKEKARVNLLEEYENKIYNPRDFNRETKEYKNLTPLLKKGKDTFELVNRYYKIFEELFSGHKILNDNYSFDNLILMMTMTLPADYWIAALLKYYENYEDKNILSFLIKLDNKFSSDWILSYPPTTRIENVNKIIKKIDETSNVENIINNSDVFKIDLDSFNGCLNDNLYGRRFARYLLYKLNFIYQGDTTKMNSPRMLSVEHILPQNPHGKSEWIKDFTLDERKEWTNKIGNLMLITRRKNSAQGRKDYAIKKKKYFEANVEVFPLSIKIITKHETWTLDDLTTNHKRVANKLMEHYRK